MGSARRSSTSDIDRAGQILLPGNFYRGAFAAGQEPPPDGTQHVVIINTMDRPPGEHWMCEYRDGPNRLLYDSFGRLPSVQWQPRLVDVETTERDAVLWMRMNVAGSQTNVGAMHTLVTWRRNHAKRDNVDALHLKPKAMQIDSCAPNIPTFILPHCTNLPYIQLCP